MTNVTAAKLSLRGVLGRRGSPAMDSGAGTLLTCPGDPSGEAQAAGARLEVFAVLLSMLHLP